MDKRIENYIEKAGNVTKTEAMEALEIKSDKAFDNAMAKLRKGRVDLITQGAGSQPRMSSSFSPSSCLSWRFSSSRALSLLASETSIPPNLDFHR